MYQRNELPCFFRVSVTCSGIQCIDDFYVSLNGALGLDDVELLSAKQIRLTGELFCEWHACRYQ